MDRRRLLEGILPASEACSITLNKEKELEAELKDITEGIKKSCFAGQWNYTYIGEISAAAKMLLQERGYEVIDTGGFLERPEVTIKW